MDLLGDDELERSAVVANCRMNRERGLVGSNGYVRELGFSPLDFLRERVASGHLVAWLDLCCGTGRALIQAARLLRDEGLSDGIAIVGVDLVGMFDRPDPGLQRLRLVEASLTAWRPDRQFDLITCVHGLHYVGDKLGLIARAASWLAEDGLFVASLDLHNLKFADGKVSRTTSFPPTSPAGGDAAPGRPPCPPCRASPTSASVRHVGRVHAQDRKPVLALAGGVIEVRPAQHDLLALLAAVRGCDPSPGTYLAEVGDTHHDLPHGAVGQLLGQRYG
jgi:SAM-dependent methyltransferase